MKYKIVLNFFSVIVILIVGSALYKQFDYEHLKFEKPALAVVYSITLILSIAFMIKKTKK
ncbi:MAG: hypothetical protein COA67_07300 [Lutibacter sp.]|nr:MAG: hypothetical protein COA67_07300 [Lutibacter sp.]